MSVETNNQDTNESAYSEQVSVDVNESDASEIIDESKSESSTDLSEELVHVVPDFDYDSVVEWDGGPGFANPWLLYYSTNAEHFIKEWFETPDALAWVTVLINDAKVFPDMPNDAKDVKERSECLQAFLKEAGRPFWMNDKGSVLTAPLTFNEISNLATNYGGYMFRGDYSPFNEKSRWFK